MTSLEKEWWWNTEMKELIEQIFGDMAASFSLPH